MSFLDYKQQVTKNLQDLTFGRQLFFSAWITEHLFKRYGALLNEKFQQEEDLDLNEVLAFLWYMVDKEPANVDQELMSSYRESLRNDDIYGNLDQNETSGSGQANLINSLYNSLLFIHDRSLDLVVGTAFFPINVIDCILLNDIGLKDSDDLIDHPMFQAEFSAQDHVLEYLHSDKPAGSGEKDLFRETQ